ncbi:hypothetical protein [Ruicaihuangia caeni]|uniref:hypothetical protein n=1 Tax=Ruicaihuangia caeni TaxID=3042517 RepID=UPI00338D8DF6
MRSLVAIAAALALGVGLVVGAPGAHDSAEAANAADFDAGYIISDANFYDDDAMTQAEIQAFLEANTGTCRNSNCLPVLRVDTFDRAANNPCKAYRGAPGESAAAVIFKVQQACNISAKVILVTLHKEQGLIGKTAPTDLELRKAMGYGCPDTASCDSRYYGFYNQVYNAAWQFGWYRIGYSTPGSSFYGKYPPGQISQILYHPYNNCGTSGVRVQNFATAALYHYTPYQPNAAALANLYGVGDTCSSYGNRNFWRMYTDWFGNPTGVDGTDDVARAFAELGGATGPLGAITLKENCTLATTTCFQRHQNGSIYWTITTGAFGVVGAYDTVYRATGAERGPMGAPTSKLIDVPSTPNGPGAGQQFQYGTIYSSAAGAFAVYGAVRAEYWANGSNSGSFGWPTSARKCVGVVCAQQFQGGAIAETGGDGYSVQGAYWTVYREHGGVNGSLGVPLGSPISVTAPTGPGAGQAFERGTIYSTAAHGTFAVSNPLRSVYWSNGSNSGPLGWPIAAQECLTGGCGQRFEGGHVFTTGVTVQGTHTEAYERAGGIRGRLGLATSGRIDVTGNPNGDGSGQTFQGGTVYASSAGAFAVSGALRAEWWRLGGNGGTLGWPIGDQACDSGALCQQAFQTGTLVQSSPSTFVVKWSAHPAYASVASAFKAQLGEATTGYIDIPVNPNGPGGGQTFERGTIYSSAAGVFPVWGAVRAEWWRLGGNGGALGWPVGNPECASGLCSQQFQGGKLVQTSASSVVLQPAVHPAYASVASAFKAQLGEATTGYIDIPVNPNGPGGGQTFERGTIYSSAAGVFPVWGAVRAEWWRLGGNGGALGWPVGNPECASGLCSQQFQGGKLVQTSASSVVLQPAVHPAYASVASAFKAQLGEATTGYIDIPVNPNGPGGGQTFERGTIYSSAAGVFPVWGAVRAEWWRLGGNGGALGWPTANPSCSGALCTQSFQGGTITR